MLKLINLLKSKFCFIAIIAVACVVLVFDKSVAFEEEVILESLIIYRGSGENKEVITRFEIEIAETPDKLLKGLMFREEMHINHGMLFIFPYKKIVKMWMKNTLIPLDILFINSEGVIVAIKRKNKPHSLKLISHEVPVKIALEVNAGAADNVKVGDFVILSLNTALLARM